MGFTVWQQARAEKLAATRPDDDDVDTGLSALVSGQRPVAGEPT